MVAEPAEPVWSLKAGVCCRRAGLKAGVCVVAEPGCRRAVVEPVEEAGAGVWSPSRVEGESVLSSSRVEDGSVWSAETGLKTRVCCRAGSRPGCQDGSVWSAGVSSRVEGGSVCRRAGRRAGLSVWSEPGVVLSPSRVEGESVEPVVEPAEPSSSRLKAGVC